MILKFQDDTRTDYHNLLAFAMVDVKDMAIGADIRMTPVLTHWADFIFERCFNAFCTSFKPC